MAKHFGFQEGNERDKIRDKAALFQPFEEDIRAYEAGHKEKGIKYDPEIRAIIEVCHEYKRKERVLSVLEKDAAVRNKLKDPMSDMIVEHADEFDESKKDLSLSDEEEVDICMGNAIAVCDRYADLLLKVLDGEMDKDTVMEALGM